MSNSLELLDLQVTRDGQPLIHGLTYRLHSNELLVVQGQNGAGKTTLLKTLAGLLPPSGGEIRLNGEQLTHDFHPRPLFIGHKRGLTPSLSVADNVRVWARAARNDELYRAALHFFDLEGLEDVPLQQLSAGWQQRVALTRLITMPAYLWLLDEPTANLDKAGVERLHALLQTRLEQGGMVVMTSHHSQIEGENVKFINISNMDSNIEVIH